MNHDSSIPMEDAIKLASTPQGQAILAQLQQQHGEKLEQAMQQAQTGDFEQVKRTLSDFLASPEGQSILKQLRG